MDEYRLFETDRFLKDVRRIARSGNRDVLEKLRAVVYPQLRQHPHRGPHIKKLRDYSPPTWRYRIGAWRFFYEIDEAEHIVFLTAAAHRSAAY